MKSPDQGTAYFFELETALHRRQIRNSADAVSKLLADGFTEFGSSGRIFSKSSIIEALQREESEQQIAVEDFTAQELAPDVVLVTYIARRPSDQAMSTLRSSIWKRIKGTWQMVFHQGTVRRPGSS